MLFFEKLFQCCPIDCMTPMTSRYQALLNMSHGVIQEIEVPAEKTCYVGS